MRCRHHKKELKCRQHSLQKVMNEKAETKQEKKRSTHACMHNCAAQRTKYSRRLLSILAQKRMQTKQKKQRDVYVCNSLYVLFARYRLLLKKEKKTEHTRIVARLCSSRNAIFTLVVVLPAQQNKKQTKYHKRVVISSDILFVTVDR